MVERLAAVALECTCCHKLRLVEAGRYEGRSDIQVGACTLHLRQQRIAFAGLAAAVRPGHAVSTTLLLAVVAAHLVPESVKISF